MTPTALDPTRTAFPPTAPRLRRVEALITLGSIAVAFGLLQGLIMTSGKRFEGVDALSGSLRLLMALPLVASTVWITSVTRDFPPRMIACFALTTGALASWMWFEALSSLYGETPFNEWVETALNVLLTVGIIGVGITGEREGARRREQERRASERDPLTGLLNRQGVMARYQGLAPGTPAALVMLDLNDLHFINSSGGHGAGDAHIRAAAQMIWQALPVQAFVGRWGGDEFVAVLPGTVPAEAEALFWAAAARVPQPRPGLSVFSAGAAQIVAGEPLERALALANQRMYERKALDYQADTLANGERGTVGLEEFSRRLELLDTPVAVLDSGLALARTLLDFEGSFYYEAQDQRLALRLFRGPEPLDLLTLQKVDRADGRPGLVETAAETGMTLWRADYPADPGALRSWVDAGLKSVVLTPVRCRGQTLGVLGLAHFSTWRAVTPQVRRLVEAVALRLGHTLERLHAVEDVRATLEGGMLGLGLALETRDLETAGHTERVVDLAGRLGRALGLDGPQLGDLRQGAYLHDIGKLAIPDAVLLKPGKLDAAEWALMQTHAARGMELAARIPTLSPGALHVIRHHHERWDGRGYPDGLAGEAIPLVARIFAVCDVYDALTSLRPYKPAWTRQEALAELQAQRGEQFDPAVVDAFLEEFGTPPLPDVGFSVASGGPLRS